METPIPVAAAPAEPAPARLNPIRRAVLVFTHPTRAWEGLEQHAQWWWPLLVSGESTLPNVVARLPFLPMPNARARGISALVLARIEPEESGDDRALI